MCREKLNKIRPSCVLPSPVFCACVSFFFFFFYFVFKKRIKLLNWILLLFILLLLKSSRNLRQKHIFSSDPMALLREAQRQTALDRESKNTDTFSVKDSIGQKLWDMEWSGRRLLERLKTGLLLHILGNSSVTKHHRWGHKPIELAHSILLCSCVYFLS